MLMFKSCVGEAYRLAQSFNTPLVHFNTWQHHDLLPPSLCCCRVNTQNPALLCLLTSPASAKQLQIITNIFSEQFFCCCCHGCQCNISQPSLVQMQQPQFACLGPEQHWSYQTATPLPATRGHHSIHGKEEKRHCSLQFWVALLMSQRWNASSYATTDGLFCDLCLLAHIVSQLTCHSEFLSALKDILFVLVP